MRINFAVIREEFYAIIAFDLLRTGQVEVLLPDWSMSLGGLYFVTQTARARSSKVEALSSFLTKRLSRPNWQVDPSKVRSTGAGA